MSKVAPDPTRLADPSMPAYVHLLNFESNKDVTLPLIVMNLNSELDLP